MSSKDENLYIRVIRWSLNQEGKFSFQELKDALQLDDTQESIVVDQIGSGKLLSHRYDGNSIRRNDFDHVRSKFWASARDSVWLIDHDELVFSRKAPLDAQKQATRAFVISIIALILSTLIGVIQILTPADLSKTTIEAITSNTFGECRRGSVQEYRVMQNDF